MPTEIRECNCKKRNYNTRNCSREDKFFQGSSKTQLDKNKVKLGHSSGILYTANEAQNRILEIRDNRQGKTQENNIATNTVNKELKCTCEEIRTASDEDVRAPSEEEQMKSVENNHPVKTKKEVRFDPRDDKNEVVKVPIGTIIIKKYKESSGKEADAYKVELGFCNYEIILTE
ncbi:5053_t:CDS:2 [Acaulospora morrowiae]|uniref:5053_t:CDS:1 n=1 Tax=Acaulospora morrowiae TaxID=94023 RepID=A0A9N8V569_9GLOM|nr:5053_t:CDS:2 [Acaulospora morrowiae]